VHIEPSDHHNGHGATTDAGTRRNVQAALVKATGEVDGLSDCHDVSVSRVDGHLLVTAHCECDASLSVDAAHILSGQLERHVREQVPEVDQVIVHVEPHGA
jgi:divalent metal cation (Fe/Co/Zn/Cd) transporter